MSRVEIMAKVDKTVIYIGKKKPKTDMTFGTGFRLFPGDAFMVGADIAAQMVAVRDVYAAENSPELKQFIAENPEIALEKGLIEPSEVVVKVAPDAGQGTNAVGGGKPPPPADNAKADADATDEGNTIPVNTAEIVPENDVVEQKLTEIKDELTATCVRKDMIQTWATENGLDIKLTGGREDFVAQTLDAYKAKFLSGK